MLREFLFDTVFLVKEKAVSGLGPMKDSNVESSAEDGAERLAPLSSIVIVFLHSPHRGIETDGR